MTRNTFAILTLSTLFLGCAVARADITPASSADEILDALHARGADLKTLAAKVKLSAVDNDLGGEDSRKGSLVVERKPNGDTRIRVTFTERQVGKRIEKARRDYLLDGPTLVDRDWASKRSVTRIVLRPGEKLDLFKLGEGPFPLPIGQPRENVMKEFDVKKIDSKDSAKVELTPKSNTQLSRKFKRITITVNAQGWPSEVETTDLNEEQITKAQLSEIRANEAVDPKEFELEAIDDTWSKEETPL